MKITVTPECRHEDSGWTSVGSPFFGKKHVFVGTSGVRLDGEWVIKRDRRAISKRLPGHPWLTDNGHPDPSYSKVGWTTFRVEVEP